MIDRAIPLISIGVSHRDASTDMRAPLTLSQDESISALQEWNRRGIAGLILATCQRTELYLPHGSGVDEAIMSVFAGRDARTVRRSLRYAQTHVGSDAVRHLLRVASGLESTAIGESEILGQVRRAVQQARDAGAMNVLTHRIADVALLTGKRVRRETQLSHHARSLVTRALTESARRLIGLAGKRVLVVGTGHMARLVLRTLRTATAREIVVTGRTPSHVAAAATQHAAVAAPWSTLGALIGEFDLVVACTATTEPVISASMLAAACARRSMARNRWPVFVDLGVPRAIEAKLGDIQATHIIDLDLLAALNAHPVEAERADITAAERIIDEEVERLHRWWRARGTLADRVTPQGKRAVS